MNATKLLKIEMRDSALAALRSLGADIGVSDICKAISPGRYAAAALLADRNSTEKFDGMLARTVAFSLVFSGVVPFFKKPEPVGSGDDCGDFDGSVVVRQLEAFEGDNGLADATLSMLLELAGIISVVRARIASGVPLLDAEQWCGIADGLNELRAFGTRHVVLGSEEDKTRGGISMCAALREQGSRVVPAGNVVPTITISLREPPMYLFPLEGISKLPSKDEFEATVKRLSPALHADLYSDDQDPIDLDDVAAHVLGQLAARALVGLGVYVGSLRYDQELGVVVKAERVLAPVSSGEAEGLAGLLGALSGGGSPGGPRRGGLNALAALMAAAACGASDNGDGDGGKPCCGGGCHDDGSKDPSPDAGTPTEGAPNSDAAPEGVAGSGGN